MLEANDSTFSVANRELISRVSISFEPGKLHLIIGPNGAGKSTLVKLLSRLLRPQSGSIKYDGSDVQHASVNGACRVQQNIGWRRFRHPFVRFNPGFAAILAAADSATIIQH